MFKKFDWKEDVSSTSLLKSSVQRNIRQNLIAQYPSMIPYFDTLIPKKSSLLVAKCRDHINIITVDGEILFFNIRDGPYFPTLKMIHQYPNMLPKIQVDKGAIKFILSGAQIMCPGLTSKGASLPDTNMPIGTIVAVMAEGKEHCCSVGVLVMSIDEIKTLNKGPGVETMHCIRDGLWNTVISV